MIIGMDFGTTNTGAALYDGQHVRLLPLDPNSSTSEICRSAIYMTRTGDYYLGSGALNTYFAQNIGRPTRFRKVWVGEIMQVFAELPVFYRDVYVYEDEFSPGRLFTSIKTALRSQDYYGTAFRGAWFSASDLVAIYLMGMKMQMESQLGARVDELVLGRPVHFSNNQVEDQVAQSRLLDAAFKAGFQKVFLEFEPVAAALAYARDLTSPETVLIFDFGGGTLDFTVMQVGRRGPSRVLATGGVPVAGDVFDQRLFRATIPRHLGEGEEYLSGGVRRPIPAHVFDTLAQPADILSLNTPQNLAMLQDIHVNSLEPDKTNALLKVVSSNYALLIFDLVERAKRQLSLDYLTRLEIDTVDFSFTELVTRSVFERAIAQEVEMIQTELQATLDRAGLKPVRIDRVIRTGGSSQIPLFVELLSRQFGYDKVQAIDIFSSVASGLAIRARQLETGKAELPEYTTGSLARSTERSVPSSEASEHAGDIAQDHDRSAVENRAQPIDLSVVYKRLQVRQVAIAEPQRMPEAVLFILNTSGLFAAGLSHAWRPGNLGDLCNPLPALSIGTQLVQSALDDYLLMVTNQCKLISGLARDLYLAQQADPQGIRHSLPLDVGEKVTAFMCWNPDAHPVVTPPFVCMVTAVGQGRTFDSAMLADIISRRPYFQLERRYTGLPTRLFPVDQGAAILVGTNSGRVGYARANDLIVQPHDVLRLRMNEDLSTAQALTDDPQVFAISADGRWLNFDPNTITSGGPPGQRGQYLRRGFSIVAFLTTDLLQAGQVWAISSSGSLFSLNRILSVDHVAQVTSAHRILKLSSGDTLIGCLTFNSA